MTFSYQVFFSSINRHKLLIVLQFSCCSEVRQLVNGLPVFSDLPQYIPGLYVPMHHPVFSQVIHPLNCGGHRASVSRQETRPTWSHSPMHWRTVRNSVSGSPKAFSGSSRRLSRLPPEQNSITRTLCLEGNWKEKWSDLKLQCTAFLVEFSRPSRLCVCASSSWSAYLLHGQQPDDVAVVELPEHLELPHLDVMGAVVAQHVEDFDGYQLTRPLKHTEVSPSAR